MCEQYNGWTNRETWATALWINNDEGLLESVKDYTLTTLGHHQEDGDSVAAGCLAESLEYFFDDLGGDFAELSIEAYRMFRDIGSLYRVNWYELAESFIGDHKSALEPFLQAEAGAN